LELALAVKNTLGVKLWNPFNWGTIAAPVEVDNILVGMLEWEDDRVGGEGSEGWVKLL
jgi:hypothetical protein